MIQYTAGDIIGVSHHTLRDGRGDGSEPFACTAELRVNGRMVSPATQGRWAGRRCRPSTGRAPTRVSRLHGRGRTEGGHEHIVRAAHGPPVGAARFAQG